MCYLSLITIKHQRLLLLLLLLLSEASCWHDGPTGCANAFFGSSVRTLSGRFTLPKMSSRAVQSQGTRSASARLYEVPHHTGGTLGPPSGPLSGGMTWTRCSDHSGSEQAGQHLCEIPTPYGLWAGWPSRRRRPSVCAWWEGPQCFYWWNSMPLLIIRIIIIVVIITVIIIIIIIIIIILEISEWVD